MNIILSGRIEAQKGTAFLLKKGQKLKVTDPEGQQVSDLMCYNEHDKQEWLSSGRTMDYASSILIRKGNVLYSNRSNPMLTLAEDTCGRHDFLLTPCSQVMFEKLYKVEGHHPSCHENLYTNLEKYGIHADDIPTTFNIFMNVQFTSEGELSVDPPQSKAGDYVILEAQMDLIVGLTACSAGQSNNYRYKPIDFEVFEESKR